MYTTIKKPSDYFNTKLYTGNGTDATGITGLGFQPDFTWIKSRSDGSWHNLFDVIRGATTRLNSNSTNADNTASTTLQSFDTDGFTVGTGGDVNSNTINYASWNWKANGAGVANTDGSISSTVSANTTSGFSIVSWNGSDANATIGHGLGSAPRVIFIKNRESAEQWYVYHESMGNGNKLTLNDTSAASSAADWWQDTSPTNQVFYVSGVDGINGPHEMIAYCFAEKQGYSKFGSYTGNGITDGTFVYTGFKPAFVMNKKYGAGGEDGWKMIDNKRNSYNVVNANVSAEKSDAEATNQVACDFLSNGFKWRSASGGANASTQEYIYMAFAEEPLVGDNPATAR